MIRPIFAYGSELWSSLKPKSTNAFAKLEYQILRTTTGAYHGSRKTALHTIAGIEPIEAHLRNKARPWVASQTRQPDSIIKRLLLETPDSTIGAASRTVTSHPQKLSFGSRLPSRRSNVQLQVNLTPRHPKVEDKTAWMRAIRENNPTSTLVFTDGSGLDGMAAGASITDRGAVTWGETEPSRAVYLGKRASVADGERAGVMSALQAHSNTPEITTLTDSLTTLTSTMNVSKGYPARSGIERTIGTLLHRRHSEGHITNISWIKAHIGIPGNEAADKLVGEASPQGKGFPVITAEAIKAQARGTANRHKVKEGFGINRTARSNRALATYTWCRTNKGPHHSWLHRINKDPTSGVRNAGRRLGSTLSFDARGTRERDRSWAKSKDGRTWISRYGEGREKTDTYDAVEDFFLYCNHHMSRRH